MNYYDVLQDEPLFWSRIGFGPNPDERDEDGSVSLKKKYYDRWDEFLAEHKMFLQNGCRIQTTNIHLGWIGEDVYDYSATDKTLEAIFSLGDDVLYMPRVELNAPLEWLKANPEEIALASFADKDPKRIAEIYSTFRTAPDLERVRAGASNEPGLYLQSFFSDKWLACASEALRRFIEHLENGPYGDRIVAYHLVYGMCGEACHWGGWKEHQYWGDFSGVAEKAFFNHCKEKYGSFEATKKAYGMPDLTPDAMIPLPEERFAMEQSFSEYFRVNNQRSIDYSICLSNRVAQNICDFAKAAKQVVDKPVGAFYGYLFAARVAETGHLGLQRILDCDAVDFLCAPKSYYRIYAGGPGGSQSVPMSVVRKKMWIDELDNDTHVSKWHPDKHGYPKTFAETKTILWREVVRNLSWGVQNFWWMDLGGGYFDDEEIQAELTRIASFNRKMKQKPRKGIAEILFVIDENSFAYHTADPGFSRGGALDIVNEMTTELKLCGAPVDEYRLADLKELDLSRYKMIVFANAFSIDDEMRKVIKAIPETTLCVWNYAAGVRKGDRFDLSFAKELTDIEIAEYEKDKSYSNGYGAPALCPPLRIVEGDGLAVIDRYEDGEIKVARNKNHLLTVSPGFYAADFHGMAKEMGCHMYASAGCAVFADNRFLGFFPEKDGARLLAFKENGSYTDIISGKEAEGLNALEPSGAYIFERMA